MLKVILSRLTYIFNHKLRTTSTLVYNIWIESDVIKYYIIFYPLNDRNLQGKYIFLNLNLLNMNTKII